ncbi:hypothetical protein EOD42_22195 [Rhodovarius crocodyli]|uniref:Uncharacterized protein n=1 Tax=Rhodovarius crocodyli TaxID=1979269 RepID=A0A437M121_9PROT|nr:hypothetical protein [Rhodovarius crocodyli]RVT91368.1 hypothetical protein EOD42_22195 [Rhodovarius crocodyli]
MADYPIIFSAPMILALLAGQKTMTRRLAWSDYSPEPPKEGQPARAVPRNVVVLLGRAGSFRPSVWQKVKPGDRLWAREAWNLWYGSRDGEEWWPARTIPKEDPRLDEDARGHSCVDFPVGSTNGGTDAGKGPWRAPFYLPRWASRITMLVEEVKREPLHRISTADCLAEGVKMIRPNCFVVPGFGYDLCGLCHSSPQAALSAFWDELHGPDAWAANPEVVAMAGRVEIRNIDAPAKVAA